jgi:hypothetical protein
VDRELYGSDRCSVLVLTGVFKFLLLSRRYELRSRQHDLRSRKTRDYSHLHADLEHTAFTQYNVQKGLKIVGEAGAQTIVNELKQLPVALLFWKGDYGDEGPEDAVAPILGHPSVVSRAPTVVSCLTGTDGLDAHGHLNVGCLTGTDGLQGTAATHGADHLFTNLECSLSRDISCPRPQECVEEHDRTDADRHTQT